MRSNAQNKNIMKWESVLHANSDSLAIYNNSYKRKVLHKGSVLHKGGGRSGGTDEQRDHHCPVYLSA